MLSPAIGATITRLTAHVLDLPGKATEITPDQWQHKPAPNKWSKQEILGHLIDSAINNLKRFTEAQYKPSPYQVIGYQQDDSVRVNHYQQLPLDHLAQLWQLLNQQILYVITHIPAEQLSTVVLIPSGESKTLGWLIDDYADHLEHHLNQIFV